MRNLIIKLAVVLSLFVFTANVQAETYNIDQSHSTIGFAVKHLSVGTTRGSFTDYEGKLNYDTDDLSSFTADVNIKTSSIDTKNEARDKHLRNEDFFNVEQFPSITFKASSLEKRGGGYAIIGDLTMKDVTKNVTIPIQISGPVVSPFTNKKVIGLTGFVTVNRQDYNISWSKKLDDGGLVVSDSVDLVIEIEAHEE